MPTKKSEPLKTIRISLQLYDELRTFCDRVGIPFLAFVEDSLETATRRYELEELLNDEAEIKAKIKHRQEQAFREGFEKGVLVSLTSLNGQAAVGDKLTPQAIRIKAHNRVVTGEQMQLFDV